MHLVKKDRYTEGRQQKKTSNTVEQSSHWVSAKTTEATKATTKAKRQFAGVGAGPRGRPRNCAASAISRLRRAKAFATSENPTSFVGRIYITTLNASEKPSETGVRRYPLCTLQVTGHLP